MPIHPGAAAQRRAKAGWYPDPLGPPGQLRWWDGAAWSSNVRTPPEAVVTTRPAEPPRKRRVIGWAAIGAFALAVSGVVVAVQRGQDVCEVSATGIRFCANDDDALRQIEQAQPAIEEQASELQSQAQAQAVGEPVTAIDISGTWTGDDGFTYVIEQFGDQATITETLDGMTYGVGSGTVTGPLFTFSFNAINGSFGTGSLELDGDTLTGSFDNLVTAFSSPATLRR
jgi:hypothetical protein